MCERWKRFPPLAACLSGPPLSFFGHWFCRFLRPVSFPARGARGSREAVGVGPPFCGRTSSWRSKSPWHSRAFAPPWANCSTTITKRLSAAFAIGRRCRGQFEGQAQWPTREARFRSPQEKPFYTRSRADRAERRQVYVMDLLRRRAWQLSTAERLGPEPMPEGRRSLRARCRLQGHLAYPTQPGRRLRLLSARRVEGEAATTSRSASDGQRSVYAIDALRLPPTAERDCSRRIPPTGQEVVHLLRIRRVAWPFPFAREREWMANWSARFLRPDQRQSRRGALDVRTVPRPPTRAGGGRPAARRRAGLPMPSRRSAGRGPPRFSDLRGTARSILGDWRWSSVCGVRDAGGGRVSRASQAGPSLARSNLEQPG